MARAMKLEMFSGFMAFIFIGHRFVIIWAQRMPDETDYYYSLSLPQIIADSADGPD